MRWVKNFSRWITAVFAEHIVVQLLSASAVSYLAGLLVAFWRGVETVFSDIPPLFWPIFAGIIFLCTARRAFILPFVEYCKEIAEWYSAPPKPPELSPLRKEIELMMENVRHAHMPGTLNPDRPGNPKFITASTREQLHVLHAKLTPESCPHHSIPDPEDELEIWYLFLKRVRADIQ